MFEVLMVSRDRSLTDTMASLLKVDRINISHSFFMPSKHLLPEKENFNMLVIHGADSRMEAWKLCLDYRAAKGVLPLILVSNVVTDADLAVSYCIGVDEHIELSKNGLRDIIKAIALRPYIKNPRVIDLSGLSVDLSRHSVFRNGKKINLTHTELTLFEHLIKHPGKIFHSGELVDLLWSSPNDVFDETIRCHIKNLRKKLDVPKESESIIETIHGQGYQLNDSRI